MRLLFILTELPFPASRNGVALINCELLQNVPPGVRIDLLITNIEETAAVAALRALAPAIDRIDFTGESLSRKYRVGNLLSGILTGRNSFTQAAAARYLKTNCGRHAAVYVAPLMAALDLGLAQPLFLNAVDSFAKLNENAFRRSGKLRDRIKMWMYRGYERRCLGAARMVNFVSQADLDSVRQGQPDLPLVNISNGVDSDLFRPNESRRVPARLLFTGNFDYLPNAQAARHLALEIFPRIRAAHPGATLQIVGRNPPRDIQGLPGVDATGFVDDIVASYQSADIFVCPLLSGAGVKNKILEAMSVGMPIITSPLGVEGIEWIADGEHYLLADEPQAFADAVGRLLSDPALRRKLGANARNVAVTHFSWTPVVARYFQGIATVAAAGCKTA